MILLHVLIVIKKKVTSFYASVALTVGDVGEIMFCFVRLPYQQAMDSRPTQDLHLKH